MFVIINLYSITWSPYCKKLYSSPYCWPCSKEEMGNFCGLPMSPIPAHIIPWTICMMAMLLQPKGGNWTVWGWGNSISSEPTWKPITLTKWGWFLPSTTLTLLRLLRVMLIALLILLYQESMGFFRPERGGSSQDKWQTPKFSNLHSILPMRLRRKSDTCYFRKTQIMRWWMGTPQSPSICSKVSSMMSAKKKES